MNLGESVMGFIIGIGKCYIYYMLLKCIRYYYALMENETTFREI